MSEPVRVAVVGVGALGYHHARLYAALASAGGVRLVGVHDASPDRAAEVARQFGCPVLASLDEVIAKADAVSVVTPTVTHFDIARRLLAAGRHVLVEKPLASDTAQAEELVRLAREHGCLLQVGHVERFNPVFSYLQQVATSPRFIEGHRLSPFPKRSTDIGVVLDLMIHDLDVVLAFVQAEVVSCDAVGIPVLSGSEDIANVRLRFANGCVANLTASRVSPEQMRKIRVFSSGPRPCYVSLDYRAQEGFLYRLAREDEPESSLLTKLLASRSRSVVSEFAGRRIVREPVPIEKDEPLKLELRSFIECVRGRQTPVVTGEAARRALDLALQITRQIREQIPPDLPFSPTTP
ncbi:MAG: gfo/Idh/MocA family oxidoreductase [Verrucomicrobia bacterium]|nr:MAG: gfo/Idh/MocA family oxidoreductase [Verrucomicrobiota bacterium]